ncbi:MAG: guanylate kinase [Chitinophagaceae bacterium]
MSCSVLSYPMIVIAAPSGSGKSTLVHYLMKQFSCLAFSISATTRKIRTGEVDGKNYYYIKQEEFKQGIQKDLFLEWEMVYQDIFYGTLNKEIERILEQRKIPILDVDVQGALRIKKKNSLACTIFIEIPSLEILKQRLLTRNTETVDKINIRIEKSIYESSFKNQFNYCIMNEDLSLACKGIEYIVGEYLVSYV